MKRAYLLFLLLLTLGLGSSCYLCVVLNAQKDRVVYTEKVLEGESEAVTDVQVRTRIHYDNHLLWNTVCRMGESPVAETEFTFSAGGLKEENPKQYRGIYMETNIEYGLSTGADISELKGMALAYREMYDALEEGEELSRVVYLKDYYEFYPLRMEIDLPGYRAGFSGLNLSEIQNMDYEDVEKLQEYFRIPVLEEESREITVAKYGKNSASVGSGSTESISYYIDSLGVMDETACYFTFDVHNSEGGLMDTGYLPGGYGIYRLPYGVDETGKVGIDVDGLSMVYALDPEGILLDFAMNPGQDKLLLTTKEQGKLYLTVITVDTLETLQKLEIGEMGDSYLKQQAVYEDFIVWFFTDGRLALVSCEEGSYRPEFVVESGVPEEMNYSYESENTMDWNGEELVIASFLSDSVGYYDICGFNLTVYDKKGLVYCGQYTSSLNAEYEESYSYRCKPVAYQPIQVSWE